MAWGFSKPAPSPQTFAESAATALTALLPASDWAVVAGTATLVLLLARVLLGGERGGKRGGLPLPPTYNGGAQGQMAWWAWLLPQPLYNGVAFCVSAIDVVRGGLAKHGDVFTFNVGWAVQFTWCVSPKAAEAFFRATDAELDQGEVYKFMRPVFGKGVVFDAPPRIRFQQLRFAATGLRALCLASYVPKIEREVVAYFDEHMGAQQGEIDLLRAFSRLMILTASRCLLGDDVRDNLFADVAQLYHDLDQGIQPISFFWPGAPIEAHRTRDRARAAMVNLFSHVVAKRRAEQATGTAVKGLDVLQCFMDARYKKDPRYPDTSGRALSNDEISGLLIALLFAGQHTSSVVATWTVMLLLHDKRHRAHLRAAGKRTNFLDGDVMLELTDTLGFSLGWGARAAKIAAKKTAGRHVEKKGVIIDAADCEMTYENVKNMAWMRRSMREALRMFPPLIFLMRKVMQDRTVHSQDGKSIFMIPKGHTIAVAPGVAMRAEGAPFVDANRFNPDRFLEPEQVAENANTAVGVGDSVPADAPAVRKERKLPPFSFIGFGGGGCTHAWASSLGICR